MIDSHLQIAIKASLDAGQAIMDVYNETIDVVYKEDNSPLTKADKRANTIINAHLVPTKIPIISEENKQTDYNIRKTWSQCWIVDPLDGTKEFIKRNGEFTVNIALTIHGKPQFGVIYVPATKELYAADVVLKRALKAALKTHDTPIDEVLMLLKPLPKKTSEDQTLRIVGSRSHMNDETSHYLQQLKQSHSQIEIVPKGSSLKFCSIAENMADIYPRFAPTMEWDTAAGQAICEASGARVINQRTKKPLEYNKENLLNPWFIVDRHES